MAQLITTLHSSCGINPSFPSNSVHKLGPVNYKMPCVFETRSSLGKAVSASRRLASSKSLQRGVRCSASNNSGGQKGNVIEVENGEQLEKYIQDAGDKLVVVDISTTTCGPCKLVYPKVVKMSIEYPDTLFYKINGDKSSSTRVHLDKAGKSINAAIALKQTVVRLKKENNALKRIIKQHGMDPNILLKAKEAENPSLLSLGDASKEDEVIVRNLNLAAEDLISSGILEARLSQKYVRKDIQMQSGSSEAP